jgi:uncharacterized protein YbaP (TraB family)
MRTPSRVPFLALALIATFAGACKKSDKKESPGTGTAAPAPAPDAGGAAATPPADAAPAPATGPVRAFFFEVEKDGKVSHLLGTVHLGVAPDRLPPNVWAALDKAKVFAMETNAMDPRLLTAMQRDDGKTLEDELGADYWAKLENAIGKEIAANFRGMKAMGPATILAVRGIPLTEPMDLALAKRAKQQGADTVFLEDAMLQMELLERWLDARMLKTMLDDLDETTAKNREMLDVYARGDEASLEKLTFDRESWKEAGRSDAEFDQMTKELLTDRNASWIAPLEKVFGKGDGFAAVGAAHLVGKGSVVELLRGKGYEVTRVEP